jgi:hypothetical protein
MSTDRKGQPLTKNQVIDTIFIGGALIALGLIGFILGHDAASLAGVAIGLGFVEAGQGCVKPLPWRCLPGTSTHTIGGAAWQPVGRFDVYICLTGRQAARSDRHWRSTYSQTC